MKFNFLTKTAKQLLILTGIVGMGALSISPALADDHEGMKDSSMEMEDMPMNEASTEMEMEDMPMDEASTEMEMEDMPMDEASTEAGNIVEVASGSESFSTLVKAIEAAELGDTLANSSSSYTVFAPTDEAFNQLPEGTLEYLLQPENKEVLQQVLSYHVLPNAVASSEISGGEIESLDGGLVTEVTDEGITVNNASVVTPDIQASNGIIHGVNRVLLPGDLQSALAQELGIEETELYQ